MHVLLSRWAPPAERGGMSAIVYAGTALGTVLSMLLAGLLSAQLGNKFSPFSSFPLMYFPHMYSTVYWLLVC